MPLYDVCTSVLCDDTQVEMPEPQKAEFSLDVLEFTIYKRLQSAKMISSTFAYLDVPKYSNKRWLFSKLTLQ